MSYHNFLYPTLDVTRKLFMWLIQAMPRDLAAGADGAAGVGGAGGGASGSNSRALSVLRDRISSEFSASLDEAWMPSFCRTARRRAVQQSRWTLAVEQLAIRAVVDNTPPVVAAYVARYHRPLPAQSARPRMVASILQHNAQRRALVAEREAEWAASGGTRDAAARKRAAVRARMAASLRAAYSDSTAQAASLNQLLAGYGDASRGGKFAHHGQFDHEANVDIDKVENESEEDIQRRRAAEIETLEAQVARLTAACGELEGATAEFAAASQQLKATIADDDRARIPLERFLFSSTTKFCGLRTLNYSIYVTYG